MKVDANQGFSNAGLWVVIGIALYLCWLLARPFLTALTWATALAVVAAPLERWLERWLSPNWAALCSVCAILLLLGVPGWFLVQRIVDESKNGIGALTDAFSAARLENWAHRHGWVGRLWESVQQKLDLDQEIKRNAGAVAHYASSVLSGSLQLVVQFAIAVVMTFFFLRDRHTLLRLFRRLLPLTGAESDEFFHRISDAVRATVFGNLIVKSVQGILGGVMFWILGLPAPVICGILMALLGMVPIAGTALIWGPAALLLLLTGSWIKALVLALWGALVISLIDNVLYPILIASELRFHTLGVLVSVLGGLIVFGLAGLVLGPLILAATAALLDIWWNRTGLVTTGE